RGPRPRRLPCRSRRHGRRVPAARMTEVAAELTTEQLRSALASVLRPALGDIDVRRLARLKGGYSREMWSFDAVDRRGTSTPLILCADSAAGVVGTDAQALDRVREAALLRALHELDLPVPATYAAED